jgi:DNA-binding NarL/FixJ family response regulator
MKRTRALLADGHPLILETLRVFLEPHLQGLGTATDGKALVEAALRLKPDLIILDITMPLLSGIDAAAQIKKSLPGVKLIFITMHLNPAYLEAALNAGGAGFVSKSAACEELLDAIQSVLCGDIYVTPRISGEHRANNVNRE